MVLVVQLFLSPCKMAKNSALLLLQQQNKIFCVSGNTFNGKRRKIKTTLTISLLQYFCQYVKTLAGDFICMLLSFWLRALQNQPNFWKKELQCCSNIHFYLVKFIRSFIKRTGNGLNISFILTCLL